MSERQHLGPPRGYVPGSGGIGGQTAHIVLPVRSRGLGKKGLFAVALGAALVGALGYFLLSRSPNREDFASQTPASDVASADSGHGQGQRQGADRTADSDEGSVRAEADAVEELDKPAGLVALVIESEPAGAMVVRERDGTRLGRTPYRYDVEASAASVSFLLSLKGYRTMTIKMPGDRDGVRQVLLLPGRE